MFSSLRHKYHILKNDYQPAWQRYRALQRYIGKRNGFFVEAGANDGITQSNTTGFERWAGWRGLLVEPVPSLAAACRRNRPRCIVENCALVAEGFAGDSIEMWDAGLMSVVVGSLGSHEATCLKKAEQYQAIQPKRFTAPAETLSALLHKHQIPALDFLSLDVEGYEISILRGLDMARYAPRFLLIEGGDRPELQEFLGLSYKSVSIIGNDTLFRRAEKKE